MTQAQWTSKINEALQAGQEQDSDFCVANAAQEVAREHFTKADYEAWWAGENGSDSYPTENVKAFMAAAEDAIEKEDPNNSMDFQIWEEGNVLVKYWPKVKVS